MLVPFGVRQVDDDYCRRVSEVFDDVPNTRRVVQDVMVYSATYEDHIEAVRALFKQAAAHNVPINTSKIVFAQPSVTFDGYVVHSDGFQPDPELTRAIREFPLPQSVTNMLSFFCLMPTGGPFLGNAVQSSRSTVSILNPFISTDIKCLCP